MDERRYYGFDALRGSMMMLGIVLHSTMMFQVAPPPTMPSFPVRNSSYLFDILFALIHSFRMPAFFLLSGFFTALLVEKRGLAGTYRNRAARVLAPFAVAVVTILPLTILFMLDSVLALRFGTNALLPERSQVRALGLELMAKGFPADQPSLLHLWFLYYLLFFYLLIPLCSWLVKRGQPAAPRINAMLASPLALLGLGLFTAVTLWPYHGGDVQEGFMFLKPHVPSLIYYGSFFVLGYVFKHFPGILRTFAQHLRWYALAALVLFPLSFWCAHLEYATWPEAPFAIHLANVILHGLCTWALIYLAMGCALRFFDQPSPWSLYASQASYWVFLIHMIPVSLAGWWLLQFDLPAELKFLLVPGFATVVCFSSYHYLVQRTWIGVFLSGRRFDQDWPWRQRRPAAESASASALPK